MKDKKHIDKLFKEQLKDFDVAPEDHIWEHIEEELHGDERKKRRIIPIWWQVAGIAAGLVLLFTVANQMFNNSETDGISKDSIVDESSDTNNTLDPQNKNKILEKDHPSEINLDDKTSEQIADREFDSNTSIEANINESNNVNQPDSSPLSVQDHSVIASENSNQKDNHKNFRNKNSVSPRDVVNEPIRNKKTPTQESLTRDVITNNSDASETSSKTNKTTQDIIKDKSELDKILKSIESESNSTIARSDTPDHQNSDENSNTEELQNQDEKNNENAIEKAIAEAEDTEEKEEDEEQLNKWSVSPKVAPVYFSSIGEGSALDNQFVENTKEAEINMSYGITGSYAFNEKIKVRAGINKVQLGYKTNDVLILENSNRVAQATRQIANVNMADSMSQHSIYSARNFKFDGAPATIFTTEQGSLDQQLGFIEIPIEIEYNIVEKRIGLNLIGGFSTLFLSDNDVFAVLSNGDRTRLGEASNVKDLSYSANFGIGIDYNFSKQFQFNLEPTFKYQINTFNNTSGDFNPFFIGLYTGLSFKF